MSVLLTRILFLLCLVSVPSLAESDDKKIETPVVNKDRPKIGLALSGGGARGAAHIGVLKQLEQQHIPIDYITGTSMGALVGGLYASGLTPDEIEKIILEMDWEDVLSDAAAREDRSFRRKRDDDLYVVKPKARIKEGKFGLPSGIVVGQKVDFLLKTLTLNTTSIENFADLTIPFKALATDIVTGEAVVLDSGDLTMALRASMSIPAVFTPVEIEGQFLVDGGVANNLPINVVRDMGADIVIAVDISSPLRTREELSNVLNITDQLTGFLTKRNSQAQIAQLQETDILITPQLNEITMMDFDQAAAAIEIGYLSAADSFEKLKKLNLDNAFNVKRAAKKFDTESLVINQVILVNHSTINDELILANLTSEAGELINLSAIENDIKTLYGWQLFENVRYNLADADGKKNLVITVEEKQTGLTYLQFGMKLFNDFSGANDFDLSVAYTNPYLNDLRGEFRAGVQIGNEPAVAAELYQPIDSRAKYFINPAISYTKQRVSVFQDEIITAEYQVESISPALSFGLNISNWGELRTGLRYVDGSARVRIGDPNQDNLKYEQTSMFMAFTYDALNSLHFPTDGRFFYSEFRRTNDGLSLSSSESFNQFEFTGVNAHSWSNNTIILKAELGTTFNDNAPIQSLFSLGGFSRLSGFRDDQLSGQHKGLISGTYLRQVAENSLLPVYLGASLEYGNVWQFEDEVSFSDALAAGSVFIGVDSIIGPLYLAYGQAEGGTGTVYLYLGNLF